MHSLRFIFTADSVEDVSRHKTNMSLRFRETRMVEKGQIAQGRMKYSLHLHEQQSAGEVRGSKSST